ncbi:MAG: Fe-S protein assembly co-chaperone HscB, partial [Buchnera aphidicola]|nr:Fe-S protein assembly co-chaperone HscB [Buchnera aphidicola]
NKSYQTLKDDLKRAIYLLKINGLDINNNDFLSKKNCFLMKYFFLHEELENFKEKFDAEAILLFSKKIKNHIKKYTNQMHQALN